MIVGDIANWQKERQAFSPVLQKAVDYIRETDWEHAAPGKYELDGENMFAVVQEIETAPKANRQAECHAKYIDVQYLISGPEEMIGVGRASARNVVIEDQLETSDYALYGQVEGEFDLVLYPGMFAVFFPSDVHRPGCSATGGTRIKKAVIKVNKALLGCR